MIEGSGGPYVLSESDIVAMSSMKKILKYKLYNRYHRRNIFWQQQCKDYILRNF